MRKVCSYLLGLCAAMLLFFAASAETLAYDGYQTPIRVHVGTLSESTRATVTFGSYQASDGSLLSAGATVTLTEGKSLSSVGGNGRIRWNGTEYRGDLSCINGNIVNKLAMEDYLYGAVMKELGGYAPSVEALKAQAVACRNFACRRLENPRSADYDILSTTSDQAYGGYSGENCDTAVGQRVHEAVDATAGQVMYYDGVLVEAYYCANAGGATESAANVWGSDRAYLRGVDSPWDAYPFKGDAGTYTSLKFPTSYEWTYTISFGDLAKKITGIGAITDVTVSHEGCSSGYAKEVVVTGTDGTKSYTGSQFRSLLGLRSGNFDVVIGRSIAANHAFSSSYIGAVDFDKALRMTGKMLTVNGRGYGHGVGMSQWSACVMAERGYDYLSILNCFYGQNDGKLSVAAYR